MSFAREVVRYRTGTASLLAESVEGTGEIERWLDIEEVDGNEAGSLLEAWLSDTQKSRASVKAVLEDDPARIYQIMCALLLRKAQIHALAVLRANETNNVHSLAVQMRPVLECVGQVVFIFRHLIVAPDLLMKPERAVNTVTDYIGADYYRTLIGATKGSIGNEELRQTITAAAEAAAVSFGMPKPKVRKGRSLRQEDKVTALWGGKSWYDYLSEYFCHGDANWTGPSWQGGVGSMDMTHEFTCACLIHYLADQVALMNAYASLCPIDGNGAGTRADAALAKLHEVREASATLRNNALSAVKHNEAGQG